MSVRLSVDLFLFDHLFRLQEGASNITLAIFGSCSNLRLPPVWPGHARRHACTSIRSETSVQVPDSTLFWNDETRDLPGDLHIKKNESLLYKLEASLDILANLVGAIYPPMQVKTLIICLQPCEMQHPFKARAPLVSNFIFNPLTLQI